MARRVSVPELIGRRAELAALRAALADAQSDGGALVLVQGDAGVGKSRLVSAFVRGASGTGVTVLTGGCLQFEADIPYAPFVEALRGLPDAPSLLATGSASGDRAAEFRRVADAIAGAGGQRPVVLVLEDLHWADASTRDLVLYLHRALAHAPVLQVATLRGDEVGADHPVAKLVADLVRSPRAERLTLAPLDRSEVIALAQAILGGPPPADMVDALLARAEGNPFFTEELLAAWPTRGAVPGTVREVVITRLARLSTAAQQLARLAAVVGRSVPHDLLAAIAPLPAAELDGALRELVDHGQLVTVEPDAYRFRHALIQESLYRDLLPGERRHAHARVAGALRDHPERAVTGSAAGVAAELAHHWDAAGEPAEALAAAVLAAGAADEGLAPAEAHAHYERALRRWPEVADPGIAEDPLLERAAEAASLAGRNHRAVELTRRRLALLDERAEPERAALVYEQLSYQARSTGDWELARATSERAVELVPADSPARLRIASWPMALEMLAARFRSCIRRAEELLPQAEAAGDDMAVNRSLMSLGIGHLMLGHVDTGLEFLRRQNEFARRVGNPRFIGVGYVNMPEGLMWTDRHLEALALAREGVRRSAELGFDIYLLPIVGNVIRTLVELHRWDEALDADADPDDDPAADPFNWIFVDLPRAYVLIRRGELAAAEELLKRTGFVLDGQDDVQYGTELSTLRALLAARQGRWADARATVRDGLRLALAAEDMYLTARLVSIGVQVEADAADDARAAGLTMNIGSATAAADALLADLRGYLSTLESGGAVSLPRTHRAVALAAAERTRLGDPVPDAWAALADLAGVDRHLAGYARFREAEALLLGRGSRNRAAAALATARTIAAELGAAPLRDMIDALSDRARLTPAAAPQPSSTVDAHGLTAREAEVLELVGRGLTNAEIATELFISTKTASVHVSNILRKLGLKSRIQAAAHAQRRREGD
ncbi:MAG TPA: AAA family ATPase [Actinophytocola sp.]|uniref:helix-turn-helix transcriptional regulator n=1 Tax=Actinophytocola sp. TaxID=1872138 RepID=UPI002DBD9E0E|nr:AAA family ATPase [Actinophytocola sp.]HEU5476106.1 AAA family ATPase [Actinophytocola sp.]